MLIIHSNGQTEPLQYYKELQIKTRVNGERSLSFILLSTDESYSLVETDSIIEYNGQQYRIIKTNERSKNENSVKSVQCLHILFDLIDNDVTGTLNGSQTFNQVMTFILANTSYTFDIVDSFNSVTLEDWGDDNSLALFQKALNLFGAEFEVNNTHITIKSQIGDITDFQFRYKHNIKTLEKNVEKVGNDVKLSIKLSFAELKKAGYPYEVVNCGDTVFTIYEPIDINITNRIIEYTEYPLEPLSSTVTIANYKNTMADVQADFGNTQKRFNQVVDDNNKVRFNVLDDATQRATTAMNNALTELEFPENQGIIARDPNDEKRFVVIRSNGIYVVKNGVDAEEAITADGFVLSAGVIGTLLANHIKGGELTLGGSNNTNGILRVLDENGELVAELNAQTGGFEWLQIGDVISDSVVKNGMGDSFYVDPINGDDQNDGLSPSTPLARVQTALHRIPKYLVNNYAIYVENTTEKTWNENIEIFGFIGSGRLYVDFQGANNKLDGSVWVRNCSAYVDVKNAHVKYANTTLNGVFNAQHCTAVRFIGCNGDGRDSSNYIYHAEGHMHVQDSEGYNPITAVINGSYHSNIYAINNKGLATYGTRAQGATIIGGTGTAPMGETANTHTNNGGQVTGEWSTFDSGSAPAPTVPDTTETWTNTSSKSWRDNWGWRTDNSYIYQGEWNGYGHHRGFAYFGTNISGTVTGKTIKKIRVYAQRKSSGGYSSSVNAYFGWHGDTSQPSGTPNIPNERTAIGFKWGEGKWFDAPSSWYADFEAGTAKGIGIYTSSTGNDDYMIFEPTIKVEITYA